MGSIMGKNTMNVAHPPLKGGLGPAWAYVPAASVGIPWVERKRLPRWKSIKKPSKRGSNTSKGVWRSYGSARVALTY